MSESLLNPTEERDVLILAPLCVVCQTSSRMFVSPAEFEHVWNRDKPVAEVFPNVSLDEIEVLISGTHPECWDELFGDEE